MTELYSGALNVDYPERFKSSPGRLTRLPGECSAPSDHEVRVGGSYTAVRESPVRDRSQITSAKKGVIGKIEKTLTSDNSG